MLGLGRQIGARVEGGQVRGEGLAAALVREVGRPEQAVGAEDLDDGGKGLLLDLTGRVDGVLLDVGARRLADPGQVVALALSLLVEAIQQVG